jgi:hypothetical protein
LWAGDFYPHHKTPLIFRKPSAAEFLMAVYRGQMKFRIETLSCVMGALFITIVTPLCVRAASTEDGKNIVTSAFPEAPDTRYGAFDLFDHRSAYGQGVYPEPFLVDDTDLETNEARFDWSFTKAPGQQSSVTTAEVEKGVGLVTFEIEAPYEWDQSDGEKTQGWGNIDLGARVPFYEYVSKNGFLNTTFGTAIEVGVPTMSQVSQNTELVPKLFNDLSLGTHFTLQTIVGYSMLFGRGDDGGAQNLEYGFVFGYALQHKELPLPGVQQFIPMLEVIGETEMNKDAPGSNSLTGDVGFRANLKAIGPVQPRLGCAVVFPIDRLASQDVNWGFVTSLVFEY